MTTAMRGKRIRSAFNSMRAQRDFIKEQIARNHTIVEPAIVKALLEEIDEVNTHEAGLLPAFDAKAAEFKSMYQGMQYRADNLVTYLNRVIARLDAELAESEGEPVVEARTFGFVADGPLRAIIERDFAEVQRAYVAQCWKSVIILCGGAVEAILTDLLLRNSSAALASAKAPKGRLDITRWDFHDLIEVTVDCRLVTSGVERLSHPLREYRNLVHPSNELRNQLTFGAEEARIAMEVLNLVHRDLSN